MSGAVRLGDIGSGHGCWPSRKNIQASTTVFVNGKGWHRKTDAWAVHCCTDDDSDCHDGYLVLGSSSVFVNGLGAGRVDDAISCGSTAETGSSTVFAGG